MDLSILLSLVVGLTLGGMVGWLAMRPAQTRLQSELDRDRAVHAERLKAYQEAEGRLREAFQALSAEALNSNNQAFLHLAETRLREARTEATADIDARKKAIEDLLAPMAKTLEQVDREIKDVRAPAHRRRRAAASQRLRVARHDGPGPAQRRPRGWSTRSSGRASAAAGASCS